MPTIVDKNDGTPLTLDTTLTELAAGDDVRVMRFYAPADCWLVYSNDVDEGDAVPANKFPIPAGVMYPIEARTGRRAFVAAVTGTVAASAIGLGLAALLFGAGGPSGGGGGGTPATPDHDDLGHLDWELGQHTGQVDSLAAFDGTGEATYAEIGTDVQAQNANLEALSGLTGAAAKGIRFTGAGAMATYDLTAFALTLLDDSDGAAVRTTIDAQQHDADLDAYAGVSGVGLVAHTGAGAAAARTLVMPAAGITGSNLDGSGGNPTLTLANDLAALEALSGVGFAARTGTDSWALRTFEAGAGIDIDFGDGSDDPSISTLVVYASTVHTSTASQFTITLPTNCSRVTVTTLGGGGKAGAGVTGDASANRAGGRGGGSGASASVTRARSQLPTTLYGFVSAGQNTTIDTPGLTAAFLADPSYTAGAAEPASTYILCAARCASAQNGGAAMSSQLVIGFRNCIAHESCDGQTAGTAAASGTPTAIVPFNPAANGSPLSCGCSGGGKNTTPTAGNGGGYAADGPFGAIAGGAAPGGAGAQQGGYGGAGGGYTSAVATDDQILGSLGGTGGAAATAGTGGTGGDGGVGGGGGGGGASSTGTSVGGHGGRGSLRVECT